MTEIQVGQSGDSFSINERGRTHNFLFSDIERIYGEKKDRITYDEIELGLEFLDGNTFWIKELETGFQALVLAIQESVGSFPPDWYAMVEVTDPGSTTTLWQRGDR
ncbi:MAG TPA: hypothetical protein VGC56_16505 [Allosphingosinicella sp.]|jgi:hypothetical protein